MGMAVGGRWNTEAAQFLRILPRRKARTVPAPLKQATITSVSSRWSAILAHAGMHAFAASLLSLPADNAIDGDGVLPPLGQFVAQELFTSTDPGRLPGQ
eukprot:Skav231954  [mRNA]  locus=scaffold2806:1718:2014:- [translate_table: standard]